MATTSSFSSDDPQMQAQQETFGPVAVFVLALMLASVLVLTVVSPSTSAIRPVSVLLLAFSLFFALYGGWNGVYYVFLAGVLVSTIVANLLGAAWLGTLGGYVIALAWLGFLVFAARWVSRNFVPVLSDRAILIGSTIRGDIRQAQPPNALPILPDFQRKLAEIPLYELDTEVTVSNINTNAGGDNIVDSIKVHVRYRVAAAKKALINIPNRSQTQREVADQLGVSIAEAPTRLEFWEKLLSQQMASEVDDIVREIVREQPNAMIAFRDMKELAVQARDKLDQEIQRWGVTTTMLSFEQVNVKPDLYRRIQTGGSKDREDADRRRLAGLEAERVKLLMEQLSSGERDRVRGVLEALRNADVKLTPEIVIAVIQGGLDTVVEGEIIPTLPMMFPPEKKA